MTTQDAPKTFISYAWTTPEHQLRVRQMVDQLRRDGVDALLDIYHLRPGMEANAYMEQIAARGEVSKVIAICDPNYVYKVDNRLGGAGKEGTIMSEAVYQQMLGGTSAAKKFVAVIFDKKEDTPLTPAMFSSSLHIDMTDPAQYAEKYDDLLRFLFDQPRLEAPPVGQRPAHLQAQNPTSITANTWPQAAALRRAVGEGRGIKPASQGYFDALRDELLAMPSALTEHRFDLTKGLKTAEEYLPLRDEFIELMRYCIQYDALDTDSVVQFIEQSLSQLRSGHSWEPPIEFQMHHLLLRELFLYLIAVLIQEEKPQLITDLTDRTYFITINDQERAEGFGAIHYVTNTFRNEYNVLQGKCWIRPEGEWLFERAKRVDISHNDLIQADALLFLKALIHRYSDIRHAFWHPVSGPYWRSPDLFRLFRRWSSQRQFLHWQPLIGMDAQELRVFLQQTVGQEAIRQYANTEIFVDAVYLFSTSDYATRP